jgi:hypothetical protein
MPSGTHPICYPREGGVRHTSLPDGRQRAVHSSRVLVTERCMFVYNLPPQEGGGRKEREAQLEHIGRQRR